MRSQGQAWIRSEEGGDDYWAEGIKCSVEVETVDEDEVRVGIQLIGEDTDDCSLYLSRSEADRLARYLSAASVQEVKVAA